MAVVVATGVTADGGREMLGLDVGDSEDEVFWRAFLRSLKERGLAGTRLVISDQHAGLVAALGRVFQGVGHQRSFVNMGGGGMVPLVHLRRRERTGINVTNGGPTADTSLPAVADLDWPVGVVPFEHLNERPGRSAARGGHSSSGGRDG